MSYNNASIPLPVKLRKAAKYQLKFDLQAEGIELQDGKLWKAEDWKVDFSQRKEIENMGYKELREFLKPLTKGARFIVYRMVENHSISDREIMVEYSAWRDAQAWIKVQPKETKDFLKVQEIGAKTLVVDFGLRWWREFQEFIDLYKPCAVEGRNWRSHYQIRYWFVKILSQAPYKKLPLWVKKELLRIGTDYSLPIGSDRAGDIWKLIPCVKAWKWCPELPKNIAHRIGQMIPAKRVAAKYAWRKVLYISHYTWSRQQRYNRFWIEFQKLVNNPIALLEAIAENDYHQKNGYEARQVEIVCGLPYKFVSSFSKEEIDDYYQYLDKDQLLINLFGTNAKSVKKAWDASQPMQMRWAIALAPKGNPDVVCKFLAAESVLFYEEEAVDFLLSLPWKSRLKMIQTRLYKVRGQEHLVTDYLVRDTGMLFSNIVRQGNTPELGRVRCWLTCHEELGRQYIKTLPDQPVNIPSDWQQVNGLCAVDGKWSIHLPTSTGELKFWGETLHNCVGGYGEKINRGAAIVFTVKVDGQTTYCVEIDTYNNRCSQFSGQRNSMADSSIKNSVLAALSQAKLVEF